MGSLVIVLVRLLVIERQWTRIDHEQEHEHDYEETVRL
jgi:hypothetical protein